MDLQPVRMRAVDLLVTVPVVGMGAVIAFGAMGGTGRTSKVLVYGDVVAMLAVLVVCWSRKHWKQPAGMVPAIGFLVLCIPAVCYFQLTDYSLSKAEQLFTVTPLTVLAAMIILDRPERRRAVLWIFACTGSVVGLLAWADPDPVAMANDAIALTGSQTIPTARLISYAMLALVILATLYRRWAARAVLLGSAALLVAPLLLTGSRGPAVALVAALAVYAAVRSRGHRRVMRLCAVAAVVSGIGYFALPMLPATLGAKFTVLQGGPLDVSSATRLWLFDATWHSIQHNPLGIGWGNFWILVPSRVLTGDYGDPRHLYPHNLVLEVACEGGWLALLGLIAFVVATLRASRSAIQETTGAAVVVLLVAAVVNAMISSDVNGNVLVWVLAGAVLPFGSIRSADETPRTLRSRNVPINVRSSQPTGITISVSTVPAPTPSA